MFYGELVDKYRNEGKFSFNIEFAVLYETGRNNSISIWTNNYNK